MYTTFRRPLIEDRRLFCFPYAGGSANDYRDWAGRIPGVDVLAARLPGRDSRFNEPPTTRFEPLVDHLFEEIQPYLDVPFSLFGHSLGGLLAYELGRRLESAGRAPERVIASGTASPLLLTRPRRFSALSDEVLLAELRADGVAPGDLLANRELMALLLPILRADLEVVAGYRYDTSLQPLNAPLSLYFGQDEVPDPDALLREWVSTSVRPPDITGFPGGHFFVRTAAEAVLRQVADELLERSAL